jgi:hypothetical protein
MIVQITTRSSALIDESHAAAPRSERIKALTTFVSRRQSKKVAQKRKGRRCAADKQFRNSLCLWAVRVTPRPSFWSLLASSLKDVAPPNGNPSGPNGGVKLVDIR